MFAHKLHLELHAFIRNLPAMKWMNTYEWGSWITLLLLFAELGGAKVKVEGYYCSRRSLDISGACDKNLCLLPPPPLLLLLSCNTSSCAVRLMIVGVSGCSIISVSTWVELISNGFYFSAASVNIGSILLEREPIGRYLDLQNACVLCHFLSALTVLPKRADMLLFQC